MNLTIPLILIALAQSVTGDPATAAHTVQAGDTLSCLVGAYFADASGRPAIAASNDIADPHRVATGTRLSIPNPTGIDPAAVDSRTTFQVGRTASTAEPSPAPGRIDAANPAFTFLIRAEPSAELGCTIGIDARLFDQVIRP